jgi:3-methyl-2-oxobutanoate hydroxymethyltransferase
MTDAKPAAPARKKVSIPMLMDKMKKGEPIVQLAVYDYETAIIADRVGIDILCVSDTGGMVLFGHESTTSVSFEVMYMAQAVKRLAIRAAHGRHAHEAPSVEATGGGQRGKICFAGRRRGDEVRRQSASRQVHRGDRQAGIPVQGHIGITPMRMPQLGGFAAQGKTAERARN